MGASSCWVCHMAACHLPCGKPELNLTRDTRAQGTQSLRQVSRGWAISPHWAFAKLSESSQALECSEVAGREGLRASAHCVSLDRLPGLCEPLCT